MPGEPRELLYFIFFFGCIYNTWKYSNEPRRSLGNLCFPSATGSSQGSPRLTPPQAGVQSLPPLCLWNAIPHLLLCSASYSFFCVMFCEMSSPQRAADEIYLFISTLQTCPKNGCKQSLCLEPLFFIYFFNLKTFILKIWSL